MGTLGSCGSPGSLTSSLWRTPRRRNSQRVPAPRIKRTGHTLNNHESQNISVVISDTPPLRTVRSYHGKINPRVNRSIFTPPRGMYDLLHSGEKNASTETMQATRAAVLVNIRRSFDMRHPGRKLACFGMVIKPRQQSNMAATACLSPRPRQLPACRNRSGRQNVRPGLRTRNRGICSDL
jgi:hypothetical protein